MVDKRKSPRVKMRASVRYGLANPPEQFAFITDLSETGICIKTNQVFGVGTKLYLKITIDDVDYMAEGVVAWAKKVPHGLLHIAKCGMGVEFSRADDGLTKHYHKRKARH